MVLRDGTFPKPQFSADVVHLLLFVCTLCSREAVEHDLCPRIADILITTEVTRRNLCLSHTSEVELLPSFHFEGYWQR
eukprot:465561-Amphidinium_carterae.1